MKFKFEGSLYRVWWHHQTPEIVRENDRRRPVEGSERFDRLWRRLYPGTFCYVKNCTDLSGRTVVAMSNLHKYDVYNKFTGRFVSFHKALFELLCEFPEDKRALWQEQDNLKEIFDFVLKQYQEQMPKDFSGSNVKLLTEMTGNYTKNPWLYCKSC